MVENRELKDIVIGSLKLGAKDTRQIVDDIGFTRNQISQCLSRLKKQGIVEATRNESGKTCYQLTPNLNHIERHELAESIRFYCYNGGVKPTDPVTCLSACDKVKTCSRFKGVWSQWGETICKPK